MSANSKVCPTCSCTEIDVVDVTGESVCVNCGTILDDNNIVSSVEFQESGGGAHSVVGQFVSSTSATAFGTKGPTGRNYGIETRTNALSNGKKRIRQIAGMLRLGDHYVDSAFRLFALALQRNFTHGRRAQTVISSCLYVVCRRERSPHLLIDFADKLQLNVYALGGVFLKLCALLQLHLPLIDPSLYIHRFASQLHLGEKTHAIATTALRLVATMKRDWIETGRRPSGICGAALLLAARSHRVTCSLHDVMDVVNIGERTLKVRLEEFALTPTAQLTADQVGRLEMARVECDPPSYQRNRQAEVMRTLEAESSALLLENDVQGKRKPKVQKRREKSIEESSTDGQDVVERKRREQEEAFQNFLNGDAAYRKRHVRDLVTQSLYDVEEEAFGRDEDDESEFDYGFEDANEATVTRASRRAARVGMAKMREASQRFVHRQQREKAFYRTIEADLKVELAEEEIVDDEEIDRLILSEEEVSRKTRLWEKMNAEYLSEQAKKKEAGDANPKPKKKRKKKTVDTEAPPPDTAQHAIHKLKSKRINYDVIHELFGEKTEM